MREHDPRKEQRIIDETKANAREARVIQRDQWRQIIAEQQASGKKVSAFCLERGLPAWKFWYWRKALIGDGARGCGFVQVQVRASCEMTAHVWIEAGRWRIYVLPGFDATTLRQAVEALTAS